VRRSTPPETKILDEIQIDDMGGTLGVAPTRFRRPLRNGSVCMLPLRAEDQHSLLVAAVDRVGLVAFPLLKAAWPL